jgi:hypothetical protein
MSTYEQRYFKNGEAEPSLRELQILNNIVNNYNDDVLLAELEGKALNVGIGAKLNLITLVQGDSVMVSVDNEKREVGFFNPITGECNIYPDFIDIQSGELQEIQRLAQDRRESAIMKFSEALSNKNQSRIDYNQSEITAMLEHHKASLVDTRLVDAIADYHRFEVPGLNSSDKFDVDEYSVAAVYLADSWPAGKIMVPNYELGLRVWVYFKKIGTFKNRTTVKNIPLANLENEHDPNSAYVPKKHDEFPIIQDEHLEELVGLAMYVQAIKKYFAEIEGYDFRSDKLGLSISPGKEMPLFPPF